MTTQITIPLNSCIPFYLDIIASRVYVAPRSRLDNNTWWQLRWHGCVFCHLTMVLFPYQHGHTHDKQRVCLLICFDAAGYEMDGWHAVCPVNQPCLLSYFIFASCRPTDRKVPPSLHSGVEIQKWMRMQTTEPHGTLSMSFPPSSASKQLVSCSFFCCHESHPRRKG